MAALKKKDDDMRAMEERYKMYLEKARNVSDIRVSFILFSCFISVLEKVDCSDLYSQLLSFHACQVIRALDPKLNPATAEIQALRNQLADRDKQIVNLEVNLSFKSFSIF